MTTHSTPIRPTWLALVGGAILFALATTTNSNLVDYTPSPIAVRAKLSVDTPNQEPSTTKLALEDEACRVQFVFAGPKYNYGNFPTMQSWIRYTDPSCAIELLRPNNPALLDMMKPAEKQTLHEMSYLPILQADLLKLLAIYYLGGVVVDLDVEAVKPFPSEWTGPHTVLAACDVVLGIEVACFDDECVKTMVRKGQIQNWTMWARRRLSPFLGDLLEFVVKKFRTFPSYDAKIPVQEVAGSGTITDFVQLYGNFTKPHYQVQTNSVGKTLETDGSSVLRIHKNDEVVCIVGHDWTGGGCRGRDSCVVNHHYEGSWRNQ